MKRLDNLKPAKGSNKAKKRLGRGIGSGLGKTAGKGHKGQLARKGGKVAPGFEGGQMPLYRRLPKRGFKNHFRKDFQIVNLESLNVFESGTQVTKEMLKQENLIKDSSCLVKVLGKGSLKNALTLKCCDKISSSAKEAVSKVGGSVVEEKK